MQHPRQLFQLKKTLLDYIQYIKYHINPRRKIYIPAMCLYLTPLDWCRLSIVLLQQCAQSQV